MSTISIQIKRLFLYFFSIVLCPLFLLNDGGQWINPSYPGSLLALLPLPSKPKPSTRPRLRKKRNAPTAFGGLAHPTSSDSTTSAMESGQVWALYKIIKQIFPPGHRPGELGQPWRGKEMRLFQLKSGDGDVDTKEEDAWIDFIERRKKQHTKDPSGIRLKSCITSYHLKPCFTPGARFPCKTWFIQALEMRTITKKAQKANITFAIGMVIQLKSNTWHITDLTICGDS